MEHQSDPHCTADPHCFQAYQPSRKRAVQKIQERTMIGVTPEATLAVAEYCQDKDRVPIRIYLKIGGCGIRSFGLALEAAKPSDKQFAIDGFTYVIERKLLAQYGPIKIHSDGFSFRINGNGIQPPTGCGTCGYGCGSRGGSRCTGVCVSCETPCPTGQRIQSRRKKRHSPQ